MNYSHSYHAGNFADVFKHTVLLSLIKSLLRKDKPFCVLDTHAGPGYYDLFAEEAEKTKEYKTGIGKLFHQQTTPEHIRLYLTCIQRINNRLSNALLSSLRYYPGSPGLIHYFLRTDDRMVLTELHPKEYQRLKTNFAHDKHSSVHLLDGYKGLKAFLPPKERRGMVFIDPPFERPNEFAHLLEELPLALKRFATGVYAIWYPIKDRPPIERFHQSLKNLTQSPILIAELSIYPENSAQHLNGSGMAIINPPWQLDNHIQTYLPWLWKTLSIQGQGLQRVTFL